MRVLSQSELSRLSKAELAILLHSIAGSLGNLTEGSHELRVTHHNLQNIRRALARPEFRPR